MAISQIGTNSIAPSTTLTSPTVSGNLSFASGTNGINFNNTSAISSQTLNDYEYGTWTPSFSGQSGGTLTNLGSYYAKIGRMVYVSSAFQNVSAAITFYSNSTLISGLPFATYVNIQNSPCAFSSNYIENFGIGVVYSGPVIYTPSFTLPTGHVGYVAGVYMSSF